MSATKGAALNFRFTDFEIDIARRELRRAGAIVHVEPQVFDLLVHLIRNRDRIVAKDELIDAIWQGRIVSEATLSSRISAARRALGDSGNDQSLIRTLYKRGFRFVGDVDEDNFRAGCCMRSNKRPSLQGAVRRCGDTRAGRRTAAAPRRAIDRGSTVPEPRGTIRTRSTLRTVSTAPLPPRRRFPIADRAPPGSMRHRPATARLTLAHAEKGMAPKPGGGRHETRCSPSR